MSRRPRGGKAVFPGEPSILVSAASRRRWIASALPLAITALLVGGVLFLHRWKGVPIGDLTGDPAAVGGHPIYIGFLSQAGLFLWSAAAAICLFTASTLSRHQRLFDTRRFLFASGLLTVLLGLDDAFLLHESLFPRLGVPEKIVYSGYAAVVLVWLVRFRAAIRHSEYGVLGLALACFGTSLTLDVLEPAVGLDRFLFEDGAKFAGIVSWLTYFVSTAALALDGRGPPGRAVP